MTGDPTPLGANLDVVTIAKAFGVPVPLLVEPAPEQAARRAAVLAAAQDAGTNFIYYDRKEDEDLPLGGIQAAVDAGEVTREEIVEAFSRGMGTDW